MNMAKMRTTKTMHNKRSHAECVGWNNILDSVGGEAYGRKFNFWLQFFDGTTNDRVPPRGWDLRSFEG